MLTAVSLTATDAFRHEAVFYAGPESFLDRVATFVEEGVAGGEPVMVALEPVKLRALRHRLGGTAEQVELVDMADLGRNPACIIPAWADFVAGRTGPLRGVGEPIWPGRTPDELVECQCHEALVNQAFADADGFHLLCPYDAVHLDRDVIAEAERAHPWVGAAESARYRGDADPPPQLCAPLPDAPSGLPEHHITSETLGELRALVAKHARAAGLGELRTGDLVLATHEVATNSLRHGGGEGLLRIWHDGDTVVSEVRDGGRLDQPLAGRARPHLDADCGWGLWLANQLCDLVQLRTLPEGNLVRLHVR
jgi:anti-sigma regulatory factor (Ser/Thr protein kinase)